MSWALSVLFLSALAYLEAAPTAFAQVGWKYYLLFIILTSINIPTFYYFSRETKGLSLEEIAEQFGDEVVVHLTHITDEERKRLDDEIDVEEDEMGGIGGQHRGSIGGGQHKGSLGGQHYETKEVGP